MYTVLLPSSIVKHDTEFPIGPQATALVEGAGLTPEQWQNEPLLINPPARNYTAALVIAELHGRMGYFPACLRLRPVKDAIPPRFEVAELMNWQDEVRHELACSMDVWHGFDQRPQHFVDGLSVFENLGDIRVKQDTVFSLKLLNRVASGVIFLYSGRVEEKMFGM